MKYRKQRAEKGGTDFELCTAFVLVYPVRIPAGQGSLSRSLEIVRKIWFLDRNQPLQPG